MKNLIEQIKMHISSLSSEEIEGLLYILSTEDDITNNSLITKTGLPKETLKKFKTVISSYLQESEEERIRLNEEGEKVLGNLNLVPHKWSIAESFVFFQDSDYEKLRGKIKDIKKNYSPKPKREYDQFLATPKTSYMKAKIMLEKGLVAGRSLAFLGDDDVNSLVLASLNQEYKDITVFDIDEKLLDLINRGVKENSYSRLNTVSYDARKLVDSKYFGRFDIVVFDPPYTKSGLTVFLKRALELLGNTQGGGKYVFMYYGNSFKSPEKILKIQEVINRFGFSIEDRVEKFARYSGAESIGNASSLYILRANKFTRAPGMVNQNIYTFEKTEEEKFPFVDHIVFKVFDVKKDMLVSKSRVLSGLEKICKTHRLKIVDKHVTDFKGGGMTLSLILSNSNLTAHTWLELGSIHLDLITCSPIYNKNLLEKTISDVFDTSKIETFFIE